MIKLLLLLIILALTFSCNNDNLGPITTVDTEIDINPEVDIVPEIGLEDTFPEGSLNTFFSNA